MADSISLSFVMTRWTVGARPASTARLHVEIIKWVWWSLLPDSPCEASVLAVLLPRGGWQHQQLRPVRRIWVSSFHMGASRVILVALCPGVVIGLAFVRNTLILEKRFGIGPRKDFGEKRIDGN